MQPEIERQRHAKLLSEKLEEITSQQGYMPMRKMDSVTGIIIIRLQGDKEANVALIGRMYPRLALGALIGALEKGKLIAKGVENQLAS